MTITKDAVVCGPADHFSAAVAALVALTSSGEAVAEATKAAESMVEELAAMHLDDDPLESMPLTEFGTIMDRRKPIVSPDTLPKAVQAWKQITQEVQ